jgi:hypothetical protein
MENTFLNFNFDNEKNYFTFNCGKTFFNLQINNLDKSNLIGSLDNAFIFTIADKTNLAIYEEFEKVNISFSQDGFNLKSIKLKFINIKDLAYNANYAVIYLQDDSTIKLQAIDCKIVSFSDDTLVIICNGPSSKIEMFEQGVFSPLAAAIAPDPDPDPVVSILSETDTFVIAGSRGPEFSLGIFDDYTDNVHYRGRPIRLGVPVISTVPVYHPEMSEEDSTYYNNGKGPNSRKLFFRVVCNQELPDASVKLLIYLPNGEDTVTAPDFIDLVKISEAGQNSTYHGEYVFYEEDTIYTVDGFAYFAVYTDIIQQVSLPLQLDELPTTYTEFESPTTEIDLF